MTDNTARTELTKILFCDAFASATEEASDSIGTKIRSLACRSQEDICETVPDCLAQLGLPSVETYLSDSNNDFAVFDAINKIITSKTQGAFSLDVIYQSRA